MANESLTLLAGLGCWAMATALATAPAAAQCRLCATPPGLAKKPPATAITIDIDTAIDFSRLGLIASGQGGSATIDPETGQRIVTGALVDLRGMPVQGAVTIRGERNEHVTIDFPTRVTLSTSGGGTIELTDLTTSLGQNAKLDKDGMLSFTFGGRLVIDGASHGDFRGSIPITVDYK